jgi:hypothetical protein
MNSAEDTQPKRQSAADKLISLVTKECQLIHDHKNEPFAVTGTGNIRQVFHLNGKGFSDYFSNRFYQEHKCAISEMNFKTALAALAGSAKFSGDELDVFTRVARTADAYWVDLCNSNWEAVRIDENGWTVCSGPGVPLFQRSSSMQAIPMPIGGGTLDQLWALINVQVDDRLMILAWLIECLREDTPNVVLELVGEQGSAKSTTQEFLKMLIDPNAANLRAAPKSEQDVWVGAYNCHLVSFENISFLPPSLQDLLCVLATGGAHAARTLYTNKEETIIQLCKPIVINGIVVNVTAQDLLDRCLHIELPVVEHRLSKRDVEQTYADFYPQLVGALFDQFALALKLLANISIADADKPRMVDFACLGEAVFQANGHEFGVFLNRYKVMRQNGVRRTISSSPIGTALSQYLEDNPSGWSGQLVGLLDILNRHRPLGENTWPKSARAMGDALRRLSPALRTLGFNCKSNTKSGGFITWEITPIPTKSHFQCPGSPDVLEPGHAGHAGHGINDSNDEPPDEEDFPF